MSIIKSATDKGFMLFIDQLPILKNMPNENLGEAIKLLLENFETMEEINTNPLTNMAYELIATNIRRYREQSKVARENGLKGGNPNLNPTLKGTLNSTHKLQYNTIQNNTKKENTIQYNTIKYFLYEYEKVFLKVPLIDENMKKKIIEIMEINPHIRDKLHDLFIKLKETEFKLPDNRKYKPDLTWLLKDSNFIKFANDEIVKVKETKKDYELEKQKEMQKLAEMEKRILGKV